MSVHITKRTLIGQFALFTWCMIYVISVNLLLSDYYIEGRIFYYKNFSVQRLIVSFFAIEFCYLITKVSVAKNELLENVKSFLFIMFAIPAVFSYALFSQKYSLEFMLYCVLYWVSFCLFSKYLNFKASTRVKINWHFGSRTRRILARTLPITITTILVLAMIYELGGINFSVTLDDVYTTRAAFKESSNLLLTSLKSALGFYICPWMIVKFTERRNYTHSLLFILLQLSLYSMAKDKIHLLLLVVSIGTGLLGGIFIDNKKSWLTTAFLFLSGLSCLAIFGFSQDLIFNVFFRRFFVMPAWLQYINYEYFHDIKKLWWRQDTFLIDKLFTPVYSRSAVQMISQDYFGMMIGNPNCGMVGEAFTRCGYLGVIIYPFLLVLLLLVVSLIFRNSDKRMLFVLAFSFASSLGNDTITSTTFVAIMLLCCFLSVFYNIDMVSDDSMANIRRLKYGTNPDIAY